MIIFFIFEWVKDAMSSVNIAIIHISTAENIPVQRHSPLILGAKDVLFLRQSLLDFLARCKNFLAHTLNQSLPCPWSHCIVHSPSYNNDNDNDKTTTTTTTTTATTATATTMKTTIFFYINWIELTQNLSKTIATTM